MKNSKSLKYYLLLFFHTRCSSNFVRILGNIGSVVGGLIVGKEGLLVHVGACIALILKKGIGPMWYDMEVVFNISRMVEIIMILSHAM